MTGRILSDPIPADEATVDPDAKPSLDDDRRLSGTSVPSLTVYAAAGCMPVVALTLALGHVARAMNSTMRVCEYGFWR